MNKDDDDNDTEMLYRCIEGEQNTDLRLKLACSSMTFYHDDDNGDGGGDDYDGDEDDDGGDGDDEL